MSLVSRISAWRHLHADAVLALTVWLPTSQKWCPGQTTESDRNPSRPGQCVIHGTWPMSVPFLVGNGQCMSVGTSDHTTHSKKCKA